MTETWRPISDWEGFYEVSDLGGIRTMPRIVTRSNGAKMTLRGVLRKLPPGKNGYVSVTLSKPGDSRQRYVHQIVLETFHGPCPEGMEVLHGNGIRTDNRLSNLRYGTRSENNTDSIQHGTHPHSSKTHCPTGHPYNTENTYWSSRSDGRRFRVCRTCQRSYVRKGRVA